MSIHFSAKYSTIYFAKFSTNYAKEVSFLLYTGILDADDLGTYISNANKNTALKMHACITEFDNLDVIDQKICDICNKDPNLKEIDVLITKNTFSIYSGE